MKKRRLPPDDFQKALFAERFLPEPTPRDWRPAPPLALKSLYARFMVPKIVTPTPAFSEAVIAETSVKTLSYDEIRAMLRDMKVLQK